MTGVLILIDEMGNSIRENGYKLSNPHRPLTSNVVYPQ